MASPSSYRFRRALYYLLENQITTYALPAIAADWAANPLSEGWTPLAATDVIIGDLYAIGSNAITLCVKQTKIGWAAQGLLQAEFWTDIGVKCVSIGGNSPQEFELFGTTIIDALTDLFTGQANYELPAQRADNSWMLPTGSFFTAMWITGVMKLPAPMKSAEGVVRIPAWSLTHHSLMTYYLERNDPPPIGG